MAKLYKLLPALLLTALGLTAQANPITRAQARLVAQQLVGINDMTSDDATLQPYYIFSRGAGQGFVIASGDDATAPILGYTEQGDYTPDALPEQLKGMMKGWAEAITRAQGTPRLGRVRSPRARAIADYKKDWVMVTALVKTHWHQSPPYNLLAPVQEDGNLCATGCVATAGSQVAYYFRRDNPDALQYDTPTYGYGVPVTTSLPAGTPLEWDKMLLSGSGTAEQDNAVATLVFALGASAGLTYGPSTSGHNYRPGYWNMADALKGQLRLDYEYKSKDQVSQQEWETIIYNNLKAHRPLLYSGVHPDKGGHSVVLDGYNARTGLFHFNFGWGGQGDGWYTVDNETGMNGFNTYQDLVYNITPMVQNMTATLQDNMLHHKATSTITVKVQNNGTLGYSGFYVYLSPSLNKPSKASASDLTTVIEPGTTAELTFSVTPTTKEKMYVFLCGKNQQMLDTCIMQVADTRADLKLQHISVDATDESVKLDDMDFALTYDTKANVTVSLTNGPEGTYCQPAIQCYLEQYDTAKKTWKRKSGPVVNDQTFEAGQTKDVSFAFEGLTRGAYYRAYMNKLAAATTTTPLVSLTNDSVVYFAVSTEPSSISTATAAPAGETKQYFSLSGQHMERPAKGAAIVRQGRKTRKVMIK